jgi:nitroimidazol reductase NimA-like FMN-containing flavoprotein (pyridoxamine 5'-phosphate oxidase superfamily)
MSSTTPSDSSPTAPPLTPPITAPIGPAAPGATAGLAPPTNRSRVRRIAEFARYDRDAVHAIIDMSLLCHIAFAGGDGIHCIPTGCWRQDDHLYIHGSNGSRMIKVLQTGVQAAVTITLLDGLVLARSAFNHAMNYRSVVIYGCFTALPEAEKPAALAHFLEHILPGRQAMIRPGDPKELAATTVLRVALDEASVKVRTGAPEDNPEDLDWPVWAGVLPLTLVAGVPERDPQCRFPEPAHVRDWPQRRFARLPDRPQADPTPD